MGHIARRLCTCQARSGYHQVTADIPVIESPYSTHWASRRQKSRAESAVGAVFSGVQFAEVRSLWASPSFAYESVAALVFACALAEPLWASTVIYRTDAQLIALSERVVHGRVVAQRTVKGGPDGETIYTVTTLQIIEDLTGVAGTTVETWELGGAYGNEFLYVGGAVEYRVGEEVLVCLERGPRGLRTVAMGFSKFEVTVDANGDRQLRRNLRNTFVVGGAAAGAVARERTLAEFRALAAQVTGRQAQAGLAPPQGAPLASVSEPFTLLGGSPGWRWIEADSGTPVTWYKNTSAAPPLDGGLDAVAEIQSSLSAWTSPASASITLQYGGTTFQSVAKGPWSGLPGEQRPHYVRGSEQRNQRLDARHRRRQRVRRCGRYGQRQHVQRIHPRLRDLRRRPHRLVPAIAQLLARARARDRPRHRPRPLGSGQRQHHALLVLRRGHASAAGDWPRRSCGLELHLSRQHRQLHVLDQPDERESGVHRRHWLGGRDHAGRMRLDRVDQLRLHRHHIRHSWQRFGLGRLQRFRELLDLAAIGDARHRRSDIHRQSGGGAVHVLDEPDERETTASERQRTVTVMAPAGCKWSATSNAPGFLGDHDDASGSGNGSVGYSVSTNGTSARSGTMTIAGQTFTVNQLGTGPTVSLDSRR